MQPFHVGGTVMSRIGERAWSCQVSRFLRADDHEHPLDLLNFYSVRQVFVLQGSVLYLCKTYDFLDSNLFIDEQGSQGVYRVDVYHDSEKFDLVFTRMWRYECVKRGQRHPVNQFPKDHPNTLDERVYDRILQHQDTEEQTGVDYPVGVRVQNEALSLIQSRFENRPVMEDEGEVEEVPPLVPPLLHELPIIRSQRANIWWIKAVHEGVQHKYYVRFMDAHVLTLSDRTLPLLYIERGPRALYQQIGDPPHWGLKPEFFFRRVYALQ